MTCTYDRQIILDDRQIILGPISNKIYENHALKENFDTPIIS